MVGDITAAAGAMERNVSPVQEVLLFASSANGEDVRVLDQEEYVRQPFPLLSLDQRLLESERSEIVHPA